MSIHLQSTGTTFKRRKARSYLQISGTKTTCKVLTAAGKELNRQGGLTTKIF